jgi:hypothetical protein
MKLHRSILVTVYAILCMYYLQTIHHNAVEAHRHTHQIMCLLDYEVEGADCHQH